MKAKAGSRTGDSLAAGGRMKAKAGSRTGDSVAAGGWMKAKARGEEEQGRQGPQQSQAPPERLFVFAGTPSGRSTRRSTRRHAGLCGSKEAVCKAPPDGYCLLASAF
nr:uncharacterized protein LOC109782512 [Aegilops tauschii subsp. strangulata]